MTLGHLLIMLMWIGGILGAMLGITWIRWQREKHRIREAGWIEYWKRQPP